MEIFESLDKEQAKVMQPLVLAMIGDSVHSLFVRTFIAKTNPVKVNKMNKLVSSVVCAGEQFKTFKKIEPFLTGEEQDIARRARNSHVHTKAKNFSYTEYIYATAFEALLGYHYVTGNTKRLNELLNYSLDAIQENSQKV